MRFATVGGVDGIEAVLQEAAVDCALRDLIGRVPVGFVAHQCDVEPVGFVTFAIAQHTINLSVAILLNERPVVAKKLERVQQVAVAKFRRVRNQGASVAVLAEANASGTLRQRINVVHSDRAGRSKVSLLGAVRALHILKILG